MPLMVPWPYRRPWQTAVAALIVAMATTVAVQACLVEAAVLVAVVL
jgi:hypothetical protein